MEYEDYPKHIRKQWKDVEEDWEKAFDLRGRRRYAARNNVRDYFCGKLHGFEIRNENDRKYFEKQMAEAKWKSEEYKRAERCTESLEKELEKSYHMKMEIIRVKKENVALQAQIIGLNRQIMEISAPATD